jgi:hypothetical protein
VINPEIVYEKTPNGGDYSEFYMLDKNGNLAKTEDEAVEFRILEKRNDGSVVETTYGLLKP